MPIEELTDYLETAAASVLFELDVRFKIGLALQYNQIGRPGLKLGSQSGGDPVRFPAIKYPKAATTLYTYGKSAVGNPLLQYLALYQSIEHFFPTFVDRASINRVRNSLRNPGFNRESDADIQRLIEQAGRGRGQGRGPKEIDQLKTTLELCIDPPDFKAWLESIDDEYKHFLLKSRVLSGTKPLGLKAEHNKSLTDQMAERVYTLRCRIVHAKESDEFIEPLLPYGTEARELRSDILLIEYLSQRVIIAGSDEKF